VHHPFGLTCFSAEHDEHGIPHPVLEPVLRGCISGIGTSVTSLGRLAPRACCPGLGCWRSGCLRQRVAPLPYENGWVWRAA
jgi:hypothetical protein